MTIARRLAIAKEADELSDRRRKAQLKVSLPGYCAPDGPSYRDVPPGPPDRQCVCWLCLHGYFDCRAKWMRPTEDGPDEGLLGHEEREITLAGMIDRGGG